MFQTLPKTIEAFKALTWEEITPFYDALAERPLTDETIEKWLADWAMLRNLLAETYARYRVKNTQDTTDDALEERMQNYLKSIYMPAQKRNNDLTKKLLASKLVVPGMELPLRKMQAEAELFSEENLALFTEEVKLSSQFNRIIGTQTVEWEGDEKTLVEMRTLFDSSDRSHRKAVWQKMAERQLADRQALNELWQELFKLRKRIAANAGYDNYRDYRWKLLKRFDYSPQDSQQFRDAIAREVVPAANRIYEKLTDELGIERLRPWDVASDTVPLIYPKLTPMTAVSELAPKSANMFFQVGDTFGNYFETMRQEELLDLPNRSGKAPGGYCTYFSVAKRPFIFMNAVGSANDVRTMLHEAGHAFHAFESNHLPYPDQRHPGHEFSEVASMAMELLASPYLTSEFGGFYDSPEEAARHRIDHLRRIITFWPYMAVVDGFQHWAYAGGDEALDTDACDAKWAELWDRFLPAVDWSGYKAVKETGWHRKQHIFRAPFYYVEYGMAQVGAIQVWRNALEDEVAGIRQYRDSLALGGTRSLPELYAKAGANFNFDDETMREIVSLLEGKIDALEGRNGR